MMLASCMIVSSLLYAESKELRGAWFAWAGSNVPSRTAIAESMEALADANFNIVYVDVWRYGYPYFRSGVFKAHTGYYTDPSLNSPLTPERDVLAEMIAEAHHAGLEVDAWFEAGFNAGITENSPIYSAHPDWLARKQNGDVAYYGQAGPSCIHVLPEVQDFLIDLCRELVYNYDIDGIEFDRVRYPSLDCGYDSYTKELFKSETGAYPPSSVSDAAWIRWRADKLTAFIAELYDSVKSLNPYVTVSNAPLPWGYEQFCQDYAPWIDEGHLDIISPQMYMTSNSDYTWRMNTELAKIERDSLMYPGISTVANSNYTDPSELAEQIRTTRSAGLKGNVIWYHHELIYNDNDYLTYLKENVYTAKAEVPYRSDNIRPAPLIIGADSSAVSRSGNWEVYSGTNVYDFYNGSHCYIAAADSAASISYSATIPASGHYSVYAFQNIPKSMSSGSDATLFTVHSDSGAVEGSIDQRTAGNAGRWEKLTDAWFRAGEDKQVLTIQTPGEGSGYTFADAVMLVHTCNPFHGKEFIYTSVGGSSGMPDEHGLLTNYPNPFNPETHIRYAVSSPGNVRIKICNLRGETVRTIDHGYRSTGYHELHFRGKGLKSGVYLCILEKDGKNANIIKITLVK